MNCQAVVSISKQPVCRYPSPKTYHEFLGRELYYQACKNEAKHAVDFGEYSLVLCDPCAHYITMPLRRTLQREVEEISATLKKSRDKEELTKQIRLKGEKIAELGRIYDASGG